MRDSSFYIILAHLLLVARMNSFRLGGFNFLLSGNTKDKQKNERVWTCLKKGETYPASAEMVWTCPTKAS